MHGFLRLPAASPGGAGDRSSARFALSAARGLTESRAARRSAAAATRDHAQSVGDWSARRMTRDMGSPNVSSTPPHDTGRPAGSTCAPPLENGDRLTRAEFERRYESRPDLKKAEPIEGGVYMPSPTRSGSHARPHASLVGWLFAYVASTPGVRLNDGACDVKGHLAREAAAGKAAVRRSPSVAYDGRLTGSGVRRNGARRCSRPRSEPGGVLHRARPPRPAGWRPPAVARDSRPGRRPRLEKRDANSLYCAE